MKSSRSVRIFTGISIATLAISAVSAVAFGTVSASINKIDAFAGIDKRPERISSAINYLLVGSDTREGLSKAELKALRVGSVATAAGKRSDTMLLVHISKARDKAVLVSIPRDSFALIPEHLNKAGKTIPATYSKINSAFNWGGAPLLIQTIEEMTELKIDHYIERQQAFMSSVLKKATSAGVLLNPVTMTNFINSSLSAVTTDEGLKNSDLITLAKQMKSLATSNVRTLTVPLSNLNYYSNGVTASVLWDPVLAPELWERLREDRAVIDEVIASPSPSATEAAKVEIIDKFKTRTAADNICR